MYEKDKDIHYQINNYNLRSELYGSNPKTSHINNFGRYNHVNNNRRVNEEQNTNNNNLNNSINNNNYIPTTTTTSTPTSNNTNFNLNDQLVSKIGLDSIISYDPSKCPFWISFSPDNSYIALSTNDSVDIFEPNSGEMLYNIRDHDQVVSMTIWFNKPYGDGNENDNIDEKYYKNITKKKTIGFDDGIPSYLKEKTSKSKYNNSFRSPYGSFLTCSLDHTINVYRNFELVAKFTEHDDWLKSMELTSDDRTLLSGCASSTICGWDLNVGVVKFRIDRAHPSDDSIGNLNTINSMKFHHYDDNVFISGARYGTMRCWDMRQGFNSPIFSVQAHNKINVIHFSQDDRHILTSGRDNTIRLWDTRTLISSPATKVEGLGTESKVEINPESGRVITSSSPIGVVKEFKRHKCMGYNIGCSFINNDRQIVSGSEDQQVYIYDVSSGEVLKKIASHRSPVHLVPVANPGNQGMGNNFRIASSSIDSCDIHMLAPILNEDDENASSEFENIANGGNGPQVKILAVLSRLVIERLMNKYGDSLFQFYHKNKIPPSSSSTQPEFVNLNKNIEKEFKSQLYLEARKIAKRLKKTDIELIQMISEDATINDISFFEDLGDDEDGDENSSETEDDSGSLLRDGGLLSPLIDQLSNLIINNDGSVPQNDEDYLDDDEDDDDDYAEENYDEEDEDEIYYSNNDEEDID